MRALFCFCLLTLGLSCYGQLNFNVVSDTIAFPNNVGVSGECVVEIENPTNANIQLNVVRLENVVQPNWFSAICTSIKCYPAGVDSVSVDVMPGDTEVVRIYFQYHSNTTDTARALMRFSNDQNALNLFYTQFLWC